MVQTPIGAIHYGAGEDQEIDTAWQPTTGPWDWEMTHADYQVYARDTFNAGDLFEFDFDGESIHFDPQSLNWVDQDHSRQQIATKQSVSAEATDDVLLFADAYSTGIDFQYEAGGTKLIKYITIDSAATLPTPTVGPTVWLELEFSLSLSSGIDFYLDGVLWERQNNVRVTTAERIEVRDSATGTQVLWWLDYPRAYDANDDTIIGEMEVRRQGGPSSLFICVRIPKTWIDSATFPIIVDPTVDTDVAASGDDGSWYEGNSGFVNDAAAIVFGDQGSPQYASNSFQRFTVSGPESGDTADVAYVTVKSRSSRSGSMTVFTCCVDADDAAAPTTYAGAEGASRTTTSSWSVGTWANNSSYNTDSIVDSVQDVLDRAGWNSGQHIVVYFEDNGSSDYRNYDSYDNGMDMPHLHLEYTAGGGPVTVNAATASLTATAQASTVTGGAVSISTSTGALTASAQAATITNPVLIGVSTGELTASPQASTVTGGPVSISAATGALTAAAQAMTVVPGAISISVNTGALTASPQTLTLVPGAISITTTTGELTASAGAATLVPGAISIPMNTGALTASAETMSLALGGLTIDAATADLTASPQAATIVPGATSVPMNLGTLTASAQSATVSTGALISAAVVDLTASAQAMTVLPGAATIDMATAALLASAQALTIVPGAVTLTMSTADLTALAQALLLVPGPITVAMAVAGLTASPQSANVSSVIPGGIVMAVVELTATAETASVYVLYLLIDVTGTDALAAGLTGTDALAASVVGTDALAAGVTGSDAAST